MIFVNLLCNKIYQNQPSGEKVKTNRCSFYCASGPIVLRILCLSCDFWAQFSINTKKWHHRTWVLERLLEIHFTCEYWLIRLQSCDFLSSTKHFLRSACVSKYIKKMQDWPLKSHRALFIFISSVWAEII